VPCEGRSGEPIAATPILSVKARSSLNAYPATPVAHPLSKSRPTLMITDRSGFLMRQTSSCYLGKIVV
jgi:hypothetical protein